MTKATKQRLKPLSEIREELLDVFRENKKDAQIELLLASIWAVSEILIEKKIVSEYDLNKTINDNLKIGIKETIEEEFIELSEKLNNKIIGIKRKTE
jgi:hypothetical protein